jgi:GNAT superfamily N-acetyltransferase
VSRALFDAVADFGRRKGMEEMIGPLGFTDFDPEGMLTMGFEELGTMATIYNYPYYPEHIEKLGGWEKDNDYVEFKIFVPEQVPEKMVKISEMIMKRYNLRVRTLTKKEIFEGGMGKRIFGLINDTFKDLYGFSELSDKQIEQYVKMYLPYADLNLIPIVEDCSTDEHRLIGVGITIPSLSRALQKCRRGRLWPFGWWHVLRALKFHKTNIIDLEMIGVLPEYRSKGVNALMFYHLIPWYNKYGIEWGESQVEMEANENVQGQWSYFNTVNHKKRRCFRKDLRG